MLFISLYSKVLNLINSNKMKTKIEKYSSRLLTLLVFVMGVSLIQAQPGGQKGGQQGPPPLPTDEQIEKIVADLSTELDLSETQEKQISELYFAHFEEVSEMVGSGDSRPEREVMEQIRSNFEIEVKSYLTKEQQKQQSNRGGHAHSEDKH